MNGFENNSQCVLEYLALFQALSAEEMDAEQCRQKWHMILEREQSSDGVQLAPPFLRQQFQLGERDFLLAMAALALEMDGGLRNTFRRKYALALPTIEYGLQLISPICPSSCETLAELAGDTMLCGLLLTTAELTAYPLERPLILCRTVKPCCAAPAVMWCGPSRRSCPSFQVWIRITPCGKWRRWLPF